MTRVDAAPGPGGLACGEGERFIDRVVPWATTTGFGFCSFMTASVCGVSAPASTMARPAPYT